MTFQPFSPKQLKVLTWWKRPELFSAYDAIIADGSVRSGKTVCMSLSFILWAFEHFEDQNFAICGKTVTSCRRNVVIPLLGMLQGLMDCRESITQGFLEISYMGKSNRFYIFGGKDEASAALIQGVTLAGVLLDEVALMPKSFVDQALARCSVDGSRFWFNCNPESPAHWFYADWIQQTKQKRALYLHFTMKDNPALSKTIRKRYEALYSGIFYKRFIRGEWTIASGAVYDMFDDSKHVKDTNENFQRSYVAIDYGTQNPCVFLLFRAGMRAGKTFRHIAKEYYHDGRKSGQKTDRQYSKDLQAFCQGEAIESIIVDPSAASLIAQLRQDGFRVIPGRNNVLSGISAVSTGLAEQTLTISPGCQQTIREFGGYVWDTKAVERGEDKPLKIDDHCMDAVRYGVYTDGKLHATRQNYSR